MSEHNRSAQESFFTAAQMPINVADPSYRSFILNFVPKGIEAGLGIIAMKTLANGGFFGGADGKPGNNPKVVPDRVSVADALHFVWSLPVSRMVCTWPVASTFIDHDTVRRPPSRVTSWP